jgi:hypothetical protein
MIRLLARLRLLKAARRDILASQGSASIVGPSRAMRQVWDAGWHPKPATYDSISQPWDAETQG